MGSVIIDGFDGIAFLHAFSGLSLVDNLLAFLFGDFNFRSLLDVVKLHCLVSLVMGYLFKHEFVLTA